MYRERWVRLQKKMRDKGIDAFLATQNVDIYYLTGSMQTGYAFVPAAGDPALFVRRSVTRAMTEAKTDVVPLASLRTFASELSARYPALFAAGSVTLATEFDVLPVQAYMRLQSAFPGVTWTDGSLLIRETRMIKSAPELKLIRQAAAVIDTAFEAGVAALHEGMTELELMAAIEHSIRRKGHLGLMRMRGYNQELITGMVGAGAAAALPTYFDGPAGGEGLSAAAPQSSGRRRIGRGEPILIDIGCCIEGYVIDQTRTAVIGELPDDLASAYEQAEQVLRRTEERLKPGTICEDLYAAALKQVKEAGLSDHFMGYGSDQVKFLGHGIGLEIDELPVLAKSFTYPLEPGIVIAIEPKFTFPGRGVVGIENSYAITENGYEQLTRSREGLIRLP
ncbi:peptidase M24 [Gordoniibacillus kamchatkensis]|uniref:Peptidase M24 n=2 Tax=Gordoniibacillus kamchatkensis TaxID=1590651 RepID=A0ABR5AE68_9BACL|nr:peptidase M24 [Paenibacillus sp. VKM B-2647]